MLLGVIALIGAGVMALIGAVRGDADAREPDGEPTAHDTPSPSPTDELPGDCRAEDLEVDVSMAATELAVGAGSQVLIELHNTAEPCLFEAGAPQVVATITSGDDTVWRSDHCATDATRLLLDTGVEHEATIHWPGRRSQPGCPGGQSIADSGTYRLLVDLAGARVGQPEGLVFVVE